MGVRSARLTFATRLDTSLVASSVSTLLFSCSVSGFSSLILSTCSLVVSMTSWFCWLFAAMACTIRKVVSLPASYT